jgi:DNA-directed RNA polymerase subunit RPC12/RpoP
LRCGGKIQSQRRRKKVHENPVARGARIWNAVPDSMSEFNFNCPACGKNIKCESWRSNTMMECPMCFQRIIVPKAPEIDDLELIIKGSKATRRLMTRPEIGSGTPTAPPAKGVPVAAIAFVVLLCAVIAVAYVFRGNIFKSAPTETIPVTNTPSTPSNPVPVSSTATVSAGNLALGKPAFASSQQSDHTIPMGNDGNALTRWCAVDGSAPQWWEVDLGEVVAITNTQITWEHSAPYQYVIEVSSDRTNWPVVVNQTDNTTPVESSSDNFSAKGRYVRLVITGLQGGSWASFYEFQVFGSSDSKK